VEDYRFANPRDNSMSRTEFYRFALEYSFRCDDTHHMWTVWFRSPQDRDAFAGVMQPFVTGGVFNEWGV